MTAEWYFHRHLKGPKIREPIQGEFFSTDVIRTPVEALIREGIQNSLDAGLDGKTVRVRFYVSGQQGSLAAERAQHYFHGCWPHIEADRNGLRDIPSSTDPCPFLVFEDFQTTGLQGDPGQWQPVEGMPNPFYSFFRTEGRSDKSNEARGRWGVGKFVFPRSGRARTFFALTARNDDKKRLLMGQTVLMSHRVEDNYFTGEGDFGIKENDDGFMLPLDHNDFIEDFCRDFRLERGTNSGLSIVVPWCTDEINKDTIFDAVVQEFFFPILAGDLEVTISDPNSEIILDRNTIVESVTDRNHLQDSELSELLALSQWALRQPEENIPLLNSSSADKAPRWSSELFPETLIPIVRSILESGNRIALRVPIVIKEKGKEQRNSFFDLFLEHDGGHSSGYPVFIREGLKISDIRKSRTRGMRSLVIIKDAPLTTFLGDSENPAHTQWQKDGSNFRGKYHHGPTTLDFVIRSVFEISRILSPSEGEEDPSLLIDLFSLPDSSEENSVRTKASATRPKPGGSVDIPEPPAPKKSNFRINSIPGGFTVSNGADFAPSAILDIQVAYDVRRGNPFTKYFPSDFELDKDPITIESEGIASIAKSRNRLRAVIRESAFQIKISGFDEKRDIKLKMKRLSNDS